MSKVYVLQHARAMDDGDDDVRLLGVFSSMEKADAAVLRFQQRPGFSQAPDGFSIDDDVVDRDSGEVGFVH